jgi:hypothetical protein
MSAAIRAARDVFFGVPGNFMLRSKLRRGKVGSINTYHQGLRLGPKRVGQQRYLYNRGWDNIRAGAQAISCRYEFDFNELHQMMICHLRPVFRASCFDLPATHDVHRIEIHVVSMLCLSCFRCDISR